MYMYIYIYTHRERGDVVAHGGARAQGRGRARGFQEYGQTADEDPKNSEFESHRTLNVEGGLSHCTV